MSHFSWCWIFSIVLSGAICGLAGCEKYSADASWWEGERTKIELEFRLSLANYRWQMASKYLATAMNHSELEAKSRLRDQMLKALRSRRGILMDEINDIQRQIELGREYVQTFRRSELIGMSLSSLRLQNGREFYDVQITAINDAGVSIRHRDGTTRLGIDDLSDLQAQEFGIDRTSAIAALAKEFEQAEAYERWLNAEMLAIEQAQREMAVSNAAIREANENRRRSDALARRISSTFRNRLLDQPPRPVRYYRRDSRSIWYYYNARPIYVYRAPVMHPYSRLNLCNHDQKKPYILATSKSASKESIVQNQLPVNKRSYSSQQPKTGHTKPQVLQKCINDSFQHSSPP